jgi:hypothetical protein
MEMSLFATTSTHHQPLKAISRLANNHDFMSEKPAMKPAMENNLHHLENIQAGREQGKEGADAEEVERCG